MMFLSNPSAGMRKMAYIYLSSPARRCSSFYQLRNCSSSPETETTATATENTPVLLLLAPPKNYNPFMNLMDERFNSGGVPPPPPPQPQMYYTENGSPTHISTGNPCLDFFFHVVPDTPSKTLIQRLELAWAHDPLTALKLVCNLRGIRGTGKSDREGYYTAALWLHENHPKTLACNLNSLIKFGYFKDVLEILYRLLEGEDIRKKQYKVAKYYVQKNKMKSENDQKPHLKRGTRSKFGQSYRRNRYSNVDQGTEDSGKTDLSLNPPKLPPLSFWDFIVGLGKIFLGTDEDSSKTTDEDSSKTTDKDSAKTTKEDSAKSKEQIHNEKARELRKKKELAKAKKLVERIGVDHDYMFLHECVSDLFAEYLKIDMEHLEAGRLNKIGLSGKWCPSIKSGYNTTTFLCDTIARKVFPRNLYPEYDEMNESKYGDYVTYRLSKKVLVPLRKAMCLPEVYISANDWESLPYNRVASVAMKRYKDMFLKKDRERFSEYLEKVKAGKTTIAAGALLPHEIIASLNNYSSEIDVADLQWKRMVSDLAGKGKLKNCMAICDVSGSMHGTPMEVSVALGLLISELSEEPWKGNLITFSANPELHVVQGDDLRSKKSFVERMQWDMNTDFQKVFDLILKVAVSGNLKEEDMIKRLFVFSDMEFDEASGSRYHGYYGLYSYRGQGGRDECRNWETDYEVICRKFKEHGYGNCVPEIVFWNLRDSQSTPVMGNQKGVALVSGYSKNLVKLFLKDTGEMSPEKVMETALSGREYQDLVIID